jgi:hypothetical protein
VFSHCPYCAYSGTFRVFIAAGKHFQEHRHDFRIFKNPESLRRADSHSFVLVAEPPENIGGICGITGFTQILYRRDAVFPCGVLQHPEEFLPVLPLGSNVGWGEEKRKKAGYDEGQSTDPHAAYPPLCGAHAPSQCIPCIASTHKDALPRPAGLPPKDHSFSLELVGILQNCFSCCITVRYHW